MEATKRQQQEDLCGLVLTYRVNDTLLCVPVEHVESVIEPPTISEFPNAPDYVIGAFMHRGRTALALSLRKLLRLPTTTEQRTKKESLLVIWMGDQPVGYWVDEIKGMTDSGRGHWSAVPALIRDQGITRALVCDGQVYFPLDLTHSNQFREITRALQAYEKNKLHSVTDEDVATAVEQVTAESAVTEQQPSREDDDYIVADYPADTTLEQTYEDHIEATAFAEHELDTAPADQAMAAARGESVSQAAPLESAEVQFDASGQGDAYLDLIPEAEAKYGHLHVVADVSDETAASVPTEGQLDAFDEAYQNLLAQETIALVPDEPLELVEDKALGEAPPPTLPDTPPATWIDTAALAEAMNAARFAELEPLSLDEAPAIEFDANGQGDAFLQLREEAELKFGHRLLAEDSQLEADEPYIDTNQLDAFGEAYQNLLEQEALDTAALLDEAEAEIADVPTAELRDEPAPDDTQADDLNLTEEPYSFLPTRLPEDDEQAPALLDAAEAETANVPTAELRDEPAPDDTPTDGLDLTEEPYSFLPTRLPEDDERDELSWQDEFALDEDSEPAGLDDTVDQPQIEMDKALDESIFEEPTLDDLPRIEEHYSFVPSSRPQDEADDVVEPTDVSDSDEAMLLLPHLTDMSPSKSALDDQPVIDSRLEQNEQGPAVDEPPSLPKFEGTISRLDYYADLMADSIPSPLDETGDSNKAESKAEPTTDSQPLEDRADIPGSADIYQFKIPLAEPERDEPASIPSLGERHETPRLKSSGIIIRPDGQESKSFGLIKVFTIILATSAAGSWWFRDELFYREQIRKEIPSILQNEIAFLYSNRVTIVSPEAGAERMIVDTPEQEIKVIRRNHVNGSLLRERRKKGVKIHRVRKGDTLWAIAERYLENPYRYPELAENSRIHNPDLIRPGDVVKITFKNIDTTD